MLYGYLDLLSGLLIACSLIAVGSVAYLCACMSDSIPLFAGQARTRSALPYRKNGMLPLANSHDLQPLQQELQVCAQQSQLCWLVEQSPSAMYLANQRGELLLANQPFCQLLGVTDTEELHRDWRNLSQLYYSQPQRWQVFADRLRTESTVQQFRSQINTRDGQGLTVYESGRLLPGATADRALFLVQVQADFSGTPKTQSWRERDELEVAQVDQLRFKQQQLEQVLLKTQELATNQPKTLRLLTSALQLVQEASALITEQSVVLASTVTTTTASNSTNSEVDDLVCRWLNETATPTITAVANAQISPVHSMGGTRPEADLLASIAVEKSTAGHELEQSLERIQSLLSSVEQPAGTINTESVQEVQTSWCGLNTAPIDFSNLARRCLDDHDFAWQMLAKFPPKFLVEWEALKQAHQQEWEGVMLRKAIQLRGMSANVGAEPLRQLLTDLETACRYSNTRKMPDILTHIEHEFGRCMRYITTELENCQGTQVLRELEIGHLSESRTVSTNERLLMEAV
jgi:PAS domain S-box-containing protein